MSRRGTAVDRRIRGRVESELLPGERLSVASTCLLGRSPWDSLALGVFVALVIWITFVGVTDFWLHESVPFGATAALLLAVLVATRASPQFVVAITDRRVLFFTPRWPTAMAGDVWLIHGLVGTSVLAVRLRRIWSEVRYRDPEGVERSLHFFGRGKAGQTAAALSPF